MTWRTYCWSSARRSCSRSSSARRSAASANPVFWATFSQEWFSSRILRTHQFRFRGTFEQFATIGALLLFFDVGYEQIDLDDFLYADRPVVIVATLGLGVPLLAGFPLGLAFGYSLESSAYLALILSVTSLRWHIFNTMTTSALCHPGSWCASIREGCRCGKSSQCSTDSMSTYPWYGWER